MFLIAMLFLWQMLLPYGKWYMLIILWQVLFATVADGIANYDLFSPFMLL